MHTSDLGEAWCAGERAWSLESADLDDAHAVVTGDHAGDRLGAALAVGASLAAVAAAGTGEVWVLDTE